MIEKIVPQGAEEFELEPGEEVELTKNETNGLLTICTMDENRLIGTVPSGYLRPKEMVKDNLNSKPCRGNITLYIYMDSVMNTSCICVCTCTCIYVCM